MPPTCERPCRPTPTPASRCRSCSRCRGARTAWRSSTPPSGPRQARKRAAYAQSTNGWARLTVRLAGAAAVSCAAVGLLATRPVAAVAPNATGWWFKLQPAGVGVPVAPPNVPPGGLFVAADPTGPTAVAALRFEVDEGAPATLALKAAQGSTTMAATIDACPASTPWSPPAGGSPGPIGDAPKADNCQPVRGQPSADGSSIGWSLPASFQTTPGRIDVVLLPS